MSPRTRYTYDLADQLRSIEDALGRTTSYDYDELARRTRTGVADPDGTGPLLSPISSVQFDLMDNPIQIGRPQSATTTDLEYDNLYRVIRRKEAEPRWRRAARATRNPIPV